MVLAAQVETLKALTERTIHDARNSRHHAAMLRVLVQSMRRNRAAF